MYSFSIIGNNTEFSVVEFSGHEEMARPYQFDIEVTSSTHDLSMTSVIGRNALLTIRRGTKTVFRHGLLEQAAIGTKYQGLTTYRFVLGPSIIQMELQSQNRIFQDLTVIDILNDVLISLGISNYEIRTSNNYTVRKYTVQYGETHLDFVHRLLQEEGIHYYFKHTSNGHKVIFSDDKANYTDLRGNKDIVFNATDTTTALSPISNFEFDRGLTVNSVSLRDYNPSNPGQDLEVTRSITSTLIYQQDDYPGGYSNLSDGQKVAQSLLDAFQVDSAMGQGESYNIRINPGHVFKLKQHTRTTLNKDYVVLGVTHKGSFDARGKEQYQNHFYCMRSNGHFVPNYGLSRRRMHGPQTATVTGPAGEEIYVDELGRVKVQFHWDRVGIFDENSSAWIRVSQFMAGAGWGSLFLPRVGHEVIVSFLDGNPDRPLVTGCVYNTANTPPYDLPAKKTQSGWKTRSTKGGRQKNFNELRFEDLKGSEEIYIHAEKDQNNFVGNDEATEIGHDRNESVGKDEAITIGENRTETVGKDEQITIGKNQKIQIGYEQNIAVGKTQEITIGNDRSVAIGKNYALDVGKKLSIIAGDVISIKTGIASIVLKKDGTITIKGKDINIQGSGKIGIKASKDLKLKGSNIR